MPPVVIRQTKQPTTGSALYKARPARRTQAHTNSSGMREPDKSPMAPGWMLFYAQQVSAAGDLVPRSFTAMAGDDAPTPTGGYAKWNVIDRPQRTGVTVFQGYDPITLAVPLRFVTFDASGGWDTSSKAGDDIERAIAALEWMAGRGVGMSGAGTPPLVWVSTTDQSGQVIPLVPFNYQSTTSADPKWATNANAPTWIIGGIDWDTKPLRNALGYRVRQECAVTLQQHVADQFDASSAARRRAVAHNKDRVQARFATTASVNTFLKLAKRYPGARGPAHAAQAILDFNQAKNATFRKRHWRGGIYKPLPLNTHLLIPLER